MSTLKILSIIYFVFMFFAIFVWIFPRKIKLMKKHGFDKTNADFIKMAKQGDVEARKVVKNSRFLLYFGVIGAALLTAIKYI